MPMTVTGLEEAKITIEQTGNKAVRGVFTQMKNLAQEATDLAKKFAPLDEGPLTESIKTEVEGGGRDDLGRFARKTVAIYIDESVTDANGRSVGEYAMDIHEHLTPYGDKKLGPRSRMKQRGQDERVGGGFIERAVSETFDAEGLSELAAASREAIGD